ncbi:MAG: type III polyketide synthase [Gemmatimonadota bacterium]|nr:type III polyketide synthase [Gemmatimonadota bacterium]
MSMLISGIGTATPPYDAPQEETARLHAELGGLDDAHARTLRALYRRSGVVRRGSVLLEREHGELRDRQRFYRPVREEGDLGPSTARRMTMYERTAPELAARAARRALTDAGVSAGAISNLVTVSCTGFTSPGVDHGLIRTLGLPRDVTRTQVGFMGCHGALNGLRVAHGFAGGEPSGRTLVCSVELCSLHFCYGWDPEVMVANALFADGAGAVVCEGLEAPTFAAEPSVQRWRVAATGTVLLDDSEEDMTWRIGDHGFRMTLSPRVPEVIGEELRSWLAGWLEASGSGLDRIATWAVHPGGPRILGAVEDALGLDRQRNRAAREVLAAHGNMSSATIFFILEKLRRENAPLPCVALAFGPGLVAEAVLVL